MTYLLRATRIRPMNRRLETRFHDLINRYCPPTRLIHGYDQDDDGSHIYLEIIIDDGNPVVAKSEFRACGFVVATLWLEGESA